jgi:hypothetical protein
LMHAHRNISWCWAKEGCSFEWSSPRVGNLRVCRASNFECGDMKISVRNYNITMWSGGRVSFHFEVYPYIAGAASPIIKVQCFY